MKRILLAVLLTLGMATNAWAMWCPQVVNATTPYRCTASAFNDSGTALTSGSVVIWDTDDTEYDRSGYPYITTTTTADHDHPAGVILDNSCADQTFCNVVVYGWARTNIAHSTDAASEDVHVATSTVAGQAGGWAGTDDTCYLGQVLELFNLDYSGTAMSADLSPMPVWVDPACEE